MSEFLDKHRVAANATPAEILRAAVARAREIPEGLNMGTWIESADTPCGTAGCLAYEICAVAGDLSERSSIASQAAKLVGLDDPSPALFFLEQWPERFQKQYKEAEGPEGRAAALAAVVEAWIEGTWYDAEGLTAGGGNVYLRGYNHPLPSSLTSIGGNVYLEGYNHPLPSSLTSIGGNVDLEGYNHPLPSSLTSIGGYVYLEGYNHRMAALKAQPYGNKK